MTRLGDHFGKTRVGGDVRLGNRRDFRDHDWAVQQVDFFKYRLGELRQRRCAQIACLNIAGCRCRQAARHAHPRLLAVVIRPFLQPYLVDGGAFGRGDKAGQGIGQFDRFRYRDLDQFCTGIGQNVETAPHQIRNGRLHGIVKIVLGDTDAQTVDVPGQAFKVIGDRQTAGGRVTRVVAGNSLEHQCRVLGGSGQGAKGIQRG